ncbi:MAG: hypothetical protein PF541_06425 [Prolixibacteraceae bacterium]|nr:hypothetical protein [Prolixibacteraceae bacterium]
MSKRKAILLIISVLAILILFYSLFYNSSSSLSHSSALVAIPPTSPLIIAIDEPVDFFEKSISNEMFSSLKTVQPFKEEVESIEQFISFLSDSETTSKLLKGKKIIISFNYSGKSDVNYLLLFSVKNKVGLELYNRALNEMKANTSLSVESRKYNKVIINQINATNQNFFVANHNGLILVSEKSILIEEAVRLSNSDFANENPELEPLLKTVGAQSDLQIFVNHSKIDRLVSKQLSNPLQKRSALLKIYSGWTELDVNLKDDKLLLSGFSNGNKDQNYYSGVFQNQVPITSKIEKVLPSSTAFYLGMNLSNVENFCVDFESFLTNRNLNFQREDQLLKYSNSADQNIQEIFADILNKEVASAGINVDQNNPTAGRVCIVDTKSGSTAISKILEIQQAYLISKKLSQADWSKDYSIDSETSFSIYKFPYPQLPTVLFGQYFKGVEANWFTVYDNYLIFGDSFRTVAKVVHANILGETLSSNLEYNKFKSNLNARSNLNFYCNTSMALPIASLFFNDEIAKLISDSDELRKFKSFAWQVSSAGDMLYNNACLQYSSSLKSKPQTIWQSHMNTTFDFKPKFVTNHYDPENKEVILQDEKNTLYLINNVGRIIWQVKFDDPIIGEIHQIDYFKNGKLQYLFNTAKKIHLVDRNGNSVKNFPINLRANATNGVAIFDYDNTKDYRFFVDCSDRNIYAYNSNGNLLKGWNIFKTDHEVKHQIQHFRVEGKDYIVASDNMKDYILHRVGTIRVPTKTIYPHSENQIYLEERTAANEPRMISTDIEGKIFYTYFDGRTETLLPPAMSAKHSFIATNIDSDESLEYIFSDKNQLLVLNNKGKTILKKRFKSNISHQPNIYRFSSNSTKIGITCKSENKIHLIDMNGAEHDGFPLEGCTQFSIGFISNESTNFNLLVGSPDGYLYNYYVE